MSIILRQEEVNYLIYNYLLEAGLQHTAHSMFYEANLQEPSKTYKSDIKAGQLINLLERSLIFSQIENHILMSDYVECKEATTLLKPHICQMVEKKREQKQKEDEQKEKFTMNAIQKGENVLKVNGSQKNVQNLYYKQNYLEENCFSTVKDEFTAKYFQSCWNKSKFILSIYEQSKNYIKNIKYLTFDDEKSIFETESIIPCCFGDKILGVMFMEWDSQTHSNLLVIYTNGIVQISDINNNIIQIFQLKENDSIRSIHWNPNWNNCLAVVYDQNIKIIDPFKAQQLVVLPIQNIQIFKWHTFDQFFVLDTFNEIHLFSLDQELPLMTLKTQENTNNIILNETKTLLASICLIDSSLKIWTLDQDQQKDLGQEKQNNQHILQILEDDRILYFNWCYSSFDGTTNYFVTVTENCLKIWDIEFGKKKFTKDFNDEKVEDFFVLKGHLGSVLIVFTKQKMHFIDVNLLSNVIFELDDYPEKLVQINEQTVLSYQKEKVVFIEFERFVP